MEDSLGPSVPFSEGKPEMVLDIMQPLDQCCSQKGGGEGWAGEEDPGLKAGPGGPVAKMAHRS